MIRPDECIVIEPMKKQIGSIGYESIPPCANEKRNERQNERKAAQDGRKSKGYRDTTNALKGRRTQNKGRRKGKAVKDHAHERLKRDQKERHVKRIQIAQNIR